MSENVHLTMAQPGVSRRPGRWAVLSTATALSAGIIAAAVYGKLTISTHGEYFNIARAIYAGRGFADPFGAATGPTAWQAPLLPALEASLLSLCDGAVPAVIRVLVVIHVSVLIATGLLIIFIAWQTVGRAGAIGTAAAFAVGLACHFRFCFEVTSDPWMNLLFLDLFIAGTFWMRPLERWPLAVGWGMLGGASAMANPILFTVWTLLTFMLGFQQRAWRHLAVTLCVAGLILTPWTIRNYLVFGRLIPVKSNLGYEFFQAQCLQPPGVLTVAAINTHPSNAGSRERREYQCLGESDYVSRKWEEFAEAVRADPLDFVDRLAIRFLCATVWYASHDPRQDAQRPWLLWLNRFAHPLPFGALVVLLVMGIQRRLSAIQWFAIGIYVLYLLPYIAASYYDRYAVPLVGVKVLLVIWALGHLVALPRWKKGDSDRIHANEK